MATTTGRGEDAAGPTLAEALAAIPLGHTERFTKTVAEADVLLFAGITGDLSPIHVLYQVATAGLSPGDIAQPIRGILRGSPNVTVASPAALARRGPAGRRPDR